MQVSRKTILRAALLGAIAVACSTDASLSPIPLACFNVSLGPWAPALPEPLPPIPDRLLLTDSLGNIGLENGRLVVEAIAPANNSYQWSWWQELPHDSIQVVFSTGFTGVSFRLARRGNDLEGAAFAFFDFQAESPKASAEFTRLSCIT